MSKNTIGFFFFKRHNKPPAKPLLLLVLTVQRLNLQHMSEMKKTMRRRLKAFIDFLNAIFSFFFLF